MVSQQGTEAKAGLDEEEEEEEHVYEHEINGKTFFITNEVNGVIYGRDGPEEVGEEVGRYVNGVPTFSSF